VVGFAAAAALSADADSRVGAPEDPRQVFLVLDGADRAEITARVSRAGFDVATGTFAEWEARAVEELRIAAKAAGDDEPIPSGVPAILQLADRHGSGFVVFDLPDRRALDGLEIARSPDADARFVALSVGDLAAPHQVTWNHPQSPTVEAPGLGVLQALFDQPRLQPQRQQLTHKPSVEELNLAHQLEPGLAMVRRVASLEALAASMERDFLDSLVEPGVRPMIRSLRSGGAVALPDGSALMISEDVALRSGDAEQLGYFVGDALHLDVLPAASSPDAELRRCDTVAGGAIPTARRPELRASADGRALAVARDGNRTVALYRWEPVPGSDGCAFAVAGQVPAPSRGERDLGVPGPDGSIARIVEGRGAQRVRVLSPRAGSSAPKGRVVELPPVQGRALTSVTWLDDHRLVAVSSGDSSDDELLVFDLERPEIVEALIPDLELGEIDFVVRAGEDGVFGAASQGRLLRVDLGAASATAGGTPIPGDATATSADAWVPRPVVVRQLLHRPTLEQPTFSADGSRVAFVTGIREDDSGRVTGHVEVVRLDDGETIARTSGAHLDAQPSFLAGGRVLIQTHARISVGHRRVAVPRLLAL
jgi:hypothetical protein